LLWVIEDSGNANKIYGLNQRKTRKSITIRMLKISIGKRLLRIKKEIIYRRFGNNENKEKIYAFIKLQRLSIKEHH
jgi:hypothetical protein